MIAELVGGLSDDMRHAGQRQRTGEKAQQRPRRQEMRGARETDEPGHRRHDDHFAAFNRRH